MPYWAAAVTPSSQEERETQLYSIWHELGFDHCVSLTWQRWRRKSEYAFPLGIHVTRSLTCI